MNTYFRITDFCNILKPRNKCGEKLYMKDRYASSFIFVRSGKIRFTEPNGSVYTADCDHPLYVPKGAEYLNECIEDAESYMISFFDNGTEKSILPLNKTNLDEIKEIFNRIEAVVFDTERNKFEILSLLYGITALLDKETPQCVPDCIANALRIMEENYGNSNLQIRGIAKEIHLSEVYFRELFGKHLGISPQNHLVKLRMEKAKIYLLEHKTVSETAFFCGYSNIYTFSRAYKRFYGFSPKNTTDY